MREIVFNHYLSLEIKTLFLDTETKICLRIHKNLLRPSLMTRQRGNVRHERDTSLVSNIIESSGLNCEEKPALFVALPNTMTEASVASGFQGGRG